ncbi:sigma-70 family RNA polymerase sigma factor [Agromyces intestinalis]|uniref:Sigma-70 family RNA polymerase sigma factor n=1 Tax=Agromyces intestinalis TaxID=2592652 RepID=A0A5C1YCP7_9MICO|nr:sigma-70 family RNA polymerase sigma factor [Agromyces intestinalis]QEO13811.1 sigma-70 family RNA polymerase sigma factor [Agromyces intestinalis]
MTEFAELWAEHRRVVRDVAYRVVGSVADAEDVTQETYVRLLARDAREPLDDPRAWLVTVASRLAIDRLRAHEHSRRAYVGPWLPEPVVADERILPEDRVTLDDSVRMALLVVLEQLTPAERTAFLLHDVFDLGFDEIAGILGVSTVSARQSASRARKRVAAHGEARFAADPAVARRLSERFARAASEGDLDGLVAILADDARGHFDSGGFYPEASTEVVVGAEAIGRQLLKAVGGRSLDFAVAEVNAEPGVIARRHGRVVSVLAFEFAGDRIVAIHGVGNPAKLAHLQGR